MTTLSRSPANRIFIVTSSSPAGDRSRSISRTGGFASTVPAITLLAGEAASLAGLACRSHAGCAAAAPGGPKDGAPGHAAGSAPLGVGLICTDDRCSASVIAGAKAPGPVRSGASWRGCDAARGPTLAKGAGVFAEGGPAVAVRLPPAPPPSAALCSSAPTGASPDAGAGRPTLPAGDGIREARSASDAGPFPVAGDFQAVRPAPNDGAGWIASVIAGGESAVVIPRSATPPEDTATLDRSWAPAKSPLEARDGENPSPAPVGLGASGSKPNTGAARAPVAGDFQAVRPAPNDGAG